MEKAIELSMDEKHEIMLDIMKDLDRHCRANGIRYTISDGTMLGAVRHGGFIPWDDDADLLMPREDFEKFVATYKSDRFKLLYNTREKDAYLVYGYAKLIDPQTTVEDKGTRSKYGVFVDIFPLDHVPEHDVERRKYIKLVRHIHNRIHHRQKHDLLSIFKSYMHSLDWWWKKLGDATVRNDRYKDSPTLVCLVNQDGGKTVLGKDEFDRLTDIEFEGHRFLGLPDPHSYLTMIYGPDYMTPKKWAHNLKMYRK